MANTIGQIVVWIFVGVLAGSVAGMLVKRRREGFGRINNLGVGMVGAIIGGSLFRLFKIDLGLGEFAVSLEDLIAALVGSLIFLGVVWLVQRQRSRSEL